MADLYVTKVTATGGRHGQIGSGDGLLDLKLALSKSLDGPGGPPIASSFSRADICKRK
jgi:lipoyl-dependent peroxiredoxin